MKKRTAWVLFLCTGLPTPALWRQADKSTGASRTGSSPEPPFRVVVRPAARQLPGPPPTHLGWLSDDPELAEHVAVVAPQPASRPTSTPRPPTARRQAPRKAAPVPSGPAPATPVRAPRTRAEKAADRASWPTSWDSLATGWDRS